MSWRGQLGSGETSFWGTGSVKWVPIPDFDRQPALGVRFEATVGRQSSETFTTFRAAPLVSKNFESEVGKMTPFAALPWAF